MKCQIDKMSNWWNGKLMRCQIDQIDEMSKLMKCQTNEMSNEM